MKVISLLLLLAACSSHEPKYDPIRSVMEAKQDEYRSCFLESESYKGRDTDERGVVMVGFTIDKEGKVTDEKITKTAFKDPSFHACLLEQIRGLKFTPPKDGGFTEVLQPINFYPTYK